MSQRDAPVQDTARKLLSHRLRGFADVENCRAGLEAACASPATYLEVDTRVSRDGRIYVSHEDSTTKFSDERMCFSQSNADVLDCVRALRQDDVARRIAERLGPPV